MVVVVINPLISV